MERHQIQLSGAKCDEVGLICGSSPLEKGATLDPRARLWSMDGEEGEEAYNVHVQ